MSYCLAIVILLTGLFSQTSVFAAEQKNGFALSEHCPPSFELTPQGQCKLVSFYQMYDSVQNRGLGGTQTSLPANRDGFTPQQIDLGRILFFDPLLSADHSVSCASCHRPDKGFSDGLDKSIGIHHAKAARSAPSLWNVGFLDKFFWDARASTLEQQAVGPLFDPKEMGNNPQQLLNSLQTNPIYPALFKQAFIDSTNTKSTVASAIKSTSESSVKDSAENSIELNQVLLALTAFQTTLISLNSRYDHYAHGYHQALSANEIAGLNIFRSFVARCAECHQPPLFTNNQIAVIGVPEKDGTPLDIGAQKTYNAAQLRGGFKVPTLRNISQTAPYMHAGNFSDLKESVEFYNKGRGHAVPPGEKLQLHWHIWEPNLSPQEIDLIVEFLGSLTDETLTPQIPDAVPSGLSPVDDSYNSKTTLANKGE